MTHRTTLDDRAGEDAAANPAGGRRRPFPYVRWGWLVAGFAAAFALGAAIGWHLMSGDQWRHGVGWERTLLLQVHSHHLPPWADHLVVFIPWLGTNWTLGPAVAVAATWLWRRRGHTKLALHLVTVLIGSSALNFALKFLFDRPRPDLWERRGQYQYAAYPSGHAIASVAVLLTAAVLLHRYRGWRWPYLAAALILGVSLYSRMYLGVHWPTDVIAGYAMGTLWLAGTLVAYTDRRTDPALAAPALEAPAAERTLEDR